MRIWHQSFTDLQAFPTYAETLQRHADDVLGSGVAVVHGLLPGTYPDRVPPMEVNRYPYVKAIHERQLTEAALTAERNGYDAFALACFFDPGLQVVRSVTDLPVVALAEASMLAACSIGSRFATISLSPFQRELTESLAREYGLAHRLAGSVELTPRISLFDLERTELVDSITGRIEVACASALDRGAEVVIPGDGVLNEFIVRNDLLDIGGAVVMDALGVLLEQAAFAVRARSSAGLRVSRRGRYARPPSAILDHVRNFAGLAEFDEGRFSGPMFGSHE